MVILADVSGLFYRTLHMNLEAVKENPVFISHLVLTQLLYQANQFGASRVNPFIVAVDSSSWRKDIYPEYKANRKKDDSIPWNQIFETYNQIINALEAYSDFFVVRVDKAEADDIIAVLTKHYKSLNKHVFIISSDKDFVQLLDSPNVSIYDPMKKVFRPSVNIDIWKKMHILIGDVSDNIKSVKKGVGEKTAEKMIKDLDLILQTNPEIRERYELNKQLIDFDCIPETIESEIMKVLKKQSHSFNGMSLLKTFTLHKLAAHSEKLNSYKFSNEAIKTKLNQQHNQKSISQIQQISLDDFFS